MIGCGGFWVVMPNALSSSSSSSSKVGMFLLAGGGRGFGSSLNKSSSSGVCFDAILSNMGRFLFSPNGSSSSPLSVNSLVGGGGGRFVKSGRLAPAGTIGAGDICTC
jgi:hypothetical protein